MEKEKHYKNSLKLELESLTTILELLKFRGSDVSGPAKAIQSFLKKIADSNRDEELLEQAEALHAAIEEEIIFPAFDRDADIDLEELQEFSEQAIEIADGILEKISNHLRLAHKS